jgi:hypothetical protein
MHCCNDTRFVNIKDNKMEVSNPRVGIRATSQDQVRWRSPQEVKVSVILMQQLSRNMDVMA